MKHKGREGWQRDVYERQRNVVFPDTVANEARFCRNVISGKGRLRASQIAGIALVGLTLAGVIYSYISTEMRTSDIQGTLSERIMGTFGGWIVLFGIAAAFLLIAWLVSRLSRMFKKPGAPGSRPFFGPRR